MREATPFFSFQELTKAPQQGKASGAQGHAGLVLEVRVVCCQNSPGILQRTVTNCPHQARFGYVFLFDDCVPRADACGMSKEPNVDSNTHDDANHTGDVAWRQDSIRDIKKSKQDIGERYLNL